MAWYDPLSMRVGKRVWSAGKLLFLIGALGATFVIAFLLSMRIAMRATEVQVPDLTGRSVNEARQILQALELRVIQQLDYEEVAGRLGCSQNAARLRVSRGLRALTLSIRGAEA